MPDRLTISSISTFSAGYYIEYITDERTDKHQLIRIFYKISCIPTSIENSVYAFRTKPHGADIKILLF